MFTVAWTFGNYNQMLKFSKIFFIKNKKKSCAVPKERAGLPAGLQPEARERASIICFPKNINTLRNITRLWQTNLLLPGYVALRTQPYPFPSRKRSFRQETSAANLLQGEGTLNLLPQARGRVRSNFLLCTDAHEMWLRKYSTTKGSPSPQGNKDSAVSLTDTKSLRSYLGAYLAGLIEGQGNIAVHDKDSNSKIYRPKIIIAFLVMVFVKTWEITCVSLTVKFRGHSRTSSTKLYSKGYKWMN